MDNNHFMDKAEKEKSLLLEPSCTLDPTPKVKQLITVITFCNLSLLVISLSLMFLIDCAVVV